jgi:hypothetical protein
MAETSRTYFIRRLIAKYTKKRDGLLVDLHKFDSRDIRIGAAEIGANGDISQQWGRQLQTWITELDGLLTDLDGLLVGARSSI